MLITSFQISNYKCFANTDEYKLSPGFNVVVGVNNVGKSALLEALSLTFGSRPYRSPSQSRFSTNDPKSLIRLTVSMTGLELKDALLQRVVREMPVTRTQVSPAQAQAQADATLKALLESPSIKFSFQRDSENNILEPQLLAHPAFPDAPDKYDLQYSLDVRAADDKIVVTNASSSTSKALGQFCYKVARYFSSQLYGFRAERLNVGECTRGVSAILKPDAGNLPEVLHVLQTRRPGRFETFNECVRLIFPSIRFVNVRFHAAKTDILEIVIWTTDTPLDRDDLAVPLAESGTGIGQVLAILYVVTSSDAPRCIVIDEPNSFLHPAAAKKLIQILRSYPQHQYVVSTHSPEIIRTADPDALIRLRWHEAKAAIDVVPARALDQQREILAELGVALSDVFGADSILWVEGPTERECFPRIRQQLCKDTLLGTSIVPMHATSDFESKRVPASTVFRLYTKLSQGTALMPPAVGFIFDAERRSEREIQDLVRESGGRARFLRRRMYENYLLHPGAIAAVLNSLPTFASQSVSESKVSDWFRKCGTDPTRGGCEASGDPFRDANWVSKVDGGRLLRELFAGLSDSREKYEKVTHGLALTDWLLSHSPEALAEGNCSTR